MSKPVLYIFQHSCWAQIPIIALPELGYADDAFEKKSINLLEGENFNPEYLKLTPNATIPILISNGETYADTKAVTSYLIKNAPKPPPAPASAKAVELIDLVHDEKIDPNVAFLAARSPEELKAKAAGFPKIFVTTRQGPLEKYAKDAPAEFAEFYKGKLGLNGFLTTVYSENPPQEAVNGWFHKSQEVYGAIHTFILTTLPSYLPSDGTFLTGTTTPGETDFHLIGWLARIVLLAGGSNDAQGINALEKELGKPVPEQLVTYWKKWSERESWKKAYADGLH